MEFLDWSGKQFIVEVEFDVPGSAAGEGLHAFVWELFVGIPSTLH